MPACDYCSATFDDEKSYLAHLRDEHADELGRIDRRRVEDAFGNEGREFSTTPIVLGGIAVISLLALAAGMLLLGGEEGAADGEPHSVGSVHEHGTISVTIDGQELDFTDDEFIRDDEHPEFHFHHGYDHFQNYIWHVHAQDVTLQYALDTLGIEVDDEGTTLTFDGETYDADAGDEVSIEVNGEPVEPGDHVLDGVGPVEDADAGAGDDVVIVVESGS